MFRLAAGVLAVLFCLNVISSHGLIGEAVAKESKKAVNKAAGFESYFNQKYGYLVQFPPYLKGEGEADAQDGQVFSSTSKPLQMRVWGTWSNWMSGTDMSIDEQRDQDLENLASDDLPNPVITYKPEGKNWYVLSGTSRGKIFYQKTIKGKGVFATVFLVYPVDHKSDLEADVEVIARSLSIPKTRKN